MDKPQETIVPVKLSVVDRLALGRKNFLAKGGKIGRYRGSKNAKTLEKEKVLKSANQLIMQRALPLVRAGLIPALGQHFVYRIDEEKNEVGKVLSRKHVLVTDADEIALALDQMEEGGTHPEDAYYYVTAKEPDHKAIEMLLNRAFGKPKESMSVDVDVKFSLKDLGKKADALEAKVIEGEFEVIKDDV